MKRLFIIGALALVLISCSDSRGSEKFLEHEGFTEITMGGFDFFAHGRDDWTTTHFTARNAAGRMVTGAVSHKPIYFIGPQWVIRIWKEEKEK
jgi:hypothetical protein